MKDKRVVIGIAAAALLIAGGLAAGWNFAPVDSALAQDGSATAEPDFTAVRHEKLVEGAKQAGIDVTGMSDDQIEAALQVKSKPSHDELVTFAKEQGIDITGMSDDQILALLRHTKLVDGAKQAGIDITGMTDDQIKAALQAKGVTDDKGSKDKSKEDSRPPLTHQELVMSAQEAGIDISGMNDDQILAALRHHKLVFVAGQMGIDISGMSNDQILAAIKAKEAQSGGKK